MELSVWSSEPFDLPSPLPEKDKWECYPAEWCYSGRGWQVLVSAVDAADEPVPNSVTNAMPEVKFVAYVTLEPMEADQQGYRMLVDVVRSLARSVNGLALDAHKQPFDIDSGKFG